MKILVTTDFSANSKGAIRFVQTLSRQTENIEVIFYHAIHVLKPTLWSDVFFKDYTNDEVARLTEDLKKYIHAIIGKDNGNFSNVKCVVHNSMSTEQSIIEYAEKNKIDFICIATRGAGMLRKIMGTHTSYIVNNSKVPVMVIPSHYRAKVIKKATYLSDFENLKNEVNRISKFSKPIDLSIEVLHYSSILLDMRKFEKNKELFNTKEFEHYYLRILKSNLELSILDRVSQYVKKTKPELLIMFTRREKSFIERLFLPSKSAELTYSTKIPLLIFSK